MPGRKQRSRYKKKRKGFQGTPSWEKKYDVKSEEKVTILSGKESAVSTHDSDYGTSCTSPSTSNKDVPSKRKLEAHSSNTPLSTSTSSKKKCSDKCYSEDSDEPPKGYRLIDMKTLGQTLTMTHKCSKGMYS